VSPTPSLSIEDSSLVAKGDISELSFSVVMAEIAEMQSWDWDDPSFLSEVVFDEKRNSDACSIPHLLADNAIDNHILDFSEQAGYYDVLDLFEESDDSVTGSAISSLSLETTPWYLVLVHRNAGASCPCILLSPATGDTRAFDL
jgi:hypothetical protein